MSCFLNLNDPSIEKNPFIETRGKIKYKYYIFALNKIEKLFNHFPNKFNSFDESFKYPFCYLNENKISIFEKYYCLRNKINKKQVCQKYEIPIETKGIFYYYQYINPHSLSCNQYIILLQKRTILWKKKLDIPFQEFYYDL